MVKSDELGVYYPILIDFGFAAKYMDKDGNHIEQGKKEDSRFQGNITFASKHQMDFKITSRRDDLISLCYLLFYVLNNFGLPGNKATFDQDRN